MNKKKSLLSSVFTKIVFALLLVLTIGLFLPIHSEAKDLDEIVNYRIVVDVNEDAIANGMLLEILFLHH